MHALHHQYFSTEINLKPFEIQLGEAVSDAQMKLSLLKNKVTQTVSLPQTPGGLPRRLTEAEAGAPKAESSY